MVYKRVTTLAGYTSRVSELLETVDRLSRADDTQTRELYLRNVSSSDTLSSYTRIPDAKRIMGDIIKFHKCANTLACTSILYLMTSVVVISLSGRGAPFRLFGLLSAFPLRGHTVVSVVPQSSQCALSKQMLIILLSQSGLERS